MYILLIEKLLYDFTVENSKTAFEFALKILAKFEDNNINNFQVRILAIILKLHKKGHIFLEMLTSMDLKH